MSKNRTDLERVFSWASAVCENISDFFGVLEELFFHAANADPDSPYNPGEDVGNYREPDETKNDKPSTNAAEPTPEKVRHFNPVRVYERICLSATDIETAPLYTVFEQCVGRTITTNHECWELCRQPVSLSVVKHLENYGYRVGGYNALKGMGLSIQLALASVSRPLVDQRSSVLCTWRTWDERVKAALAYLNEDRHGRTGGALAKVPFFYPGGPGWILIRVKKMEARMSQQEAEDKIMFSLEAARPKITASSATVEKAAAWLRHQSDFSSIIAYVVEQERHSKLLIVLLDDVGYTKGFALF